MSELSLQQLQQAFMAELSGTPNEAFRSQVKEGKLGVNRRIDIYAANHGGARTSALANVYAVCEQILGETLFLQLANDYVAQSSSSHWDLNFHGKDFDQYLEFQVSQQPELQDYFYLGELARLEWAFHVCYFAEINPPVEVTNQDPEHIKFAADTSLQLLNNQWPVYQIWFNNRNDKGEEPVENDQPAYYHLIHRTEMIPQVYSLSQAQYRLMVDCIEGKTLAELAELHGEAVSENIPLFIQQQWLRLCN